MAEYIRSASKKAAENIKAGRSIGYPIPDDSWLYETENGNS